jgi:transglutaminase-like putative cysteine protease
VRYRIDSNHRILFPAPVREHHCQIRLSPWEDTTQELRHLELSIVPTTTSIARYDGFGNLVHHFAVLDAHQALEFNLVAEVETRLSNPFAFEVVDVSREQAWLKDSLHQAPRLWDFVYHQGALTPKLPEVIAGRPTPRWRDGVAMLRQIQDALDWVHTIAEFDCQETRSVTALTDLFEGKRGTATDLAHLLIALVRGWGLPARFVSGYQDAAWFEPDDEAPEGTEPYPQTLHYWMETLIPGAAWRGFDPAFGLLADDTYVRVAVGRDASDVSPLRQTWKGLGVDPEITETLSVTRLDDAPDRP